MTIDDPTAVGVRCSVSSLPDIVPFTMLENTKFIGRNIQILLISSEGRDSLYHAHESGNTSKPIVSARDPSNTCPEVFASPQDALQIYLQHTDCQIFVRRSQH